MDEPTKEVGLSYWKLLNSISKDYGVKRDTAAAIVARVMHWIEE